MVAVVPMADKKNAPSPKPEETKKGVKVTPPFHRRLKIVAAAVGLEMGELVEREMEEFLAREEAAMKRAGK